MTTVTAQAATTVFRPATSKSRFLTGSSSGKLNREFYIKPTPSSSSWPSSFKVEAKKGEWLPGLASPGYGEMSRDDDGAMARDGD
ncbi:Chlorophyll a-b binding protein 4, chloroplastic, partial [Sarracenia purpurea var. burkii]